MRKDLFGQEVDPSQERRSRREQKKFVATEFMTPLAVDESEIWTMENVSGDSKLWIDITVGPDGKLKVERKTLREAAKALGPATAEAAKRGLF